MTVLPWALGYLLIGVMGALAAARAGLGLGDAESVPPLVVVLGWPFFTVVGLIVWLNALLVLLMGRVR